MNATANTLSGTMYANHASGLNWSSATQAEQIVILEDIMRDLMPRPGKEVVLELGSCAVTGKRYVKTVDDITDDVCTRLAQLKLALTKALGGGYADYLRETLKTRMRLECDVRQSA